MLKIFFRSFCCRPFNPILITLDLRLLTGQWPRMTLQAGMFGFGRESFLSTLICLVRLYFYLQDSGSNSLAGALKRQRLTWYLWLLHCNMCSCHMTPLTTLSQLETSLFSSLLKILSHGNEKLPWAIAKTEHLFRPLASAFHLRTGPSSTVNEYLLLMCFKITHERPICHRLMLVY